MKRHTIFIYTAALLTMLGTVLPLSAQNKSFTVNRNDGASQKYSYSQGDRLVLSREDSQGKKHADFVEQQVYVGNDVYNIPLASIESINFNTDGTVDEGKTFTVQESGGKIEYGDITLDFPAGTFKGDTKVTLYEMEKGLIDGEYESSKYYKVKLSEGVRKDFKVAIKVPRVENDNVMMDFITPGYAPSANCKVHAASYLDVNYADGKYIAEIPQMDTPDETGGMEVFYGLMKYTPIDDNASARTRNDTISVFTYDVEPILSWPKLVFEIDLFKEIKDVWIPSVIKKIKELGFSLDKKRKLPIILTSLDDDVYGVCVNSPWGKSLSVVYINERKVRETKWADGNPSVVKATLIHEILHFYQFVNDPRSPIIIYNTFPDYSLTLNEAASVWSEYFFNQKYDKKNDVKVSNIWTFLASFFPEYEEIYDYEVSKRLQLINNSGWLDRYVGVIRGWDQRYQLSGYGMGSLLMYLSQKTNDDKIVLEMFEKRKEKDVDPTDTRTIVEQVAEAHNIPIFTPECYKEFVELLGTRQIYKDIDFIEIINNRPTIGTSEVIHSIKRDGKLSFTNNAYGYGALLELLELGSNFNGNADNGLDNRICLIEQKTEGLTTWVYQIIQEKTEQDEESGEWKDRIFFPLVGQTKKGAPLEISDKFYKFQGKYPRHKFALVTIRDQFRKNSKIPSKIDVKIGDMVTPHELSFNSDGGKETLKVFSEVASFAAKPDADWITVKEDLSKKTIEVTVSESTIARNGFVTVEIMNDKSETIKTVKIPVKQEGVVLKVEPNTPLEFEAEGGTKTLTVTTSQPKWDVAKKGDWFKYSTSKNEITVTADPNPTSDPREGYLEIYALNENNEKVSKPVTIKVTQKSATSAATKYKWVKFVNVEFKGTVHIKSNDHTPEEWDDTWSTSIPRTISKQTMEENGLKVDVSDSGSLVKITKTLEYSPDHNHWIYKAEIYIDPVKNLITSLYVYEKFWLSTGNGDQPQVLTLRAENIPLEKEKSGTGTKAKGTVLNELSNNGQSGWVVFDRKWEGADDYQIKVTLSE